MTMLPLPAAPASSPVVPSLNLPGSLTLPNGRAAIMGILNVTPDSFSDGGRYLDTGAALAHARAMVGAGADLIDVGGESTRPNSTRISAQQEWERIGAVVAALASEGIIVSVDTLHASTARAAAEAGAAIINDVSGGRWDPQMNETVAATGCAYVVQHYRALPGMPGESFDYGDDLVGTIIDRISSQVNAARDAGVAPDKIVVDPGLGFSLTNDQCWQILEELPRLTSCGYPVLIGASRKRFVKALGGDVDTDSAAIAAYAVRAGAWAVRVHDVAATAAAIARKENDGE
ncbi:dihydropteroate synthase [Actinomyces bouchesdurhonensis]|uniref:dihydropteroate synthase n=1 Tax=Actinomyces bouchesdurhonensis TaxID=1852361 RepID=UPI0028EEA8AF|nr:dihydropteroate synthase [Actinomyces bouchesdurhonensis]